MVWRHRDDPIRALLTPQLNLLEVLLLALAATSGIRYLTERGGTAVGSLLGPVGAVAWGAGLLVGTVLVLGGMVWWGRPLVGLHLQQTGYFVFGAFSLARGVALFAAENPPEHPAWVLAFAVVALGQLGLIEWRIRRWLPRKAHRG